MIRPAAVAGRFYAGDPESLRRDVEACLVQGAQRSAALGAVVPHAGYLYSGPVAGAVYSSLKLPRDFILLCPNHTGYGAPFAIQTAGQWKTPLGLADINEPLAVALLESCPLLEEDTLAHRHEHALEVQLPFLQYLQPDLRFVPICVGSQQLEDLLQLGAAMAATLESIGTPALLIASSDMSHYETDAVSRRKDRMAIEPMLRLDPEGLHRTVLGQGISMCGVAPATAVLQGIRRLGGREGRLVRYATSAEASGDFSSVVGYAGITLH